MNIDIENYIRACQNCNTFKRKENIKVNLKSWPETSEPLERIHIDICGPFGEQYILVIVDSFSKWPEAFVLNTVTSETIITRLRRFFSQMGTAKLVVTDNASYFVSNRFQQWLSNIGTQHLTIAPYHPQSNGLAERFVSTIKQHIKALNSNNLQANVDRFLLQYRNSTHAVTGKSPAQSIYGRQINSPFSNQLNGKIYYWTPDKTFKPGEVLSNVGNRMVTLRNNEGEVVKRHWSQLKKPLQKSIVPDFDSPNMISQNVRCSTRQRFPVQRYGIN